MSKTVLKRWCEHCYGEDLSECCDAEVDGNRCLVCGKFCTSRPCHECEGRGYMEYRVGNEVLIFVCIYSGNAVKELYDPKKLGDTKTFEAVITDIIDDFNIEVRIKYKRGKKTYVLSPDDLEIR